MAPVQTVVNHTGTPPIEPYLLTVTSIDDDLPNNYVTSPATLEYDFHYWIHDKMMTIRNTNPVNSLNYSIYGALSETPDEGDWATLVGDGGKLAEQTLGPNSLDYQSTGNEWRHIRINCKNDKVDDVAQVKVEVRTVRHA